MTAPAPADALASLAVPMTLSVLRSMSDGEWATIAEIRAATGATEAEVHQTFSGMSQQCLEQSGELYRMNCSSAQATLKAIAAAFLAA